VSQKDSTPERQQLIALRVDSKLLAEIDDKRGRLSRSEFLRNAVYAELQEMGSTLPASITAAPDRAGKGGRPKKVVDIPRPLVAEDSPPAEERERKPVKYPKKR
jgi:hypothetical protein